MNLVSHATANAITTSHAAGQCREVGRPTTRWGSGSRTASRSSRTEGAQSTSVVQPSGVTGRPGALPRLRPHPSWVLAAAALAGLACASSGSARSADRQDRLFAAGRTVSDVSSLDAVDRPAPATRNGRVPEEVLRDPAQRMMFLERMRVQILQKTHHLAPTTYQHQVRPRLQRRLRTMGLDGADVEWILKEVDRSRA
jgi:hypothetical protein